jgi:ferredoxin-NADP reductase/nitrite reductase/ring-hydroxylating ferredoxin subunit
MLHGIRIHMSGCPSSCAGHFTADIGLKGVRVRRLIGTREGFDVFLGGGIAGQVHLALPYKLGVDVDQLPNLVEEVVREYYLQHRSGQTFSAYWREKLRLREAQKVGEQDYTPPVWVCENCDHRHAGEDPPVFCPKCAGLRRYFARIETGSSKPLNEPVSQELKADELSHSAERTADGFVPVIALSELKAGQGRQVTVDGQELALFLDGNTVHAIDNACPHEGAPLAEGDFADGVVTCPWHAWTFNACSGCSLDPQGHQVRRYPTRVDAGKVFVQMALTSTAAPASQRTAVSNRAVEIERTVVEVIDEARDVKTFRLDNSDGAVPFDLPGKFLKVCVPIDDRDVWRSFTVSSSPSRPETLDLTIKLNPAGEVSRYLFEHARPGTRIRIKGAQGGFCFDPARHNEPLVLISAGSGITPMMSILRYLRDHGLARECVFLHGARTLADVIFADECAAIATSFPELKYAVTLSQPHSNWNGCCGRISPGFVFDNSPKLAESRVFLCGPNEFMDELRESLVAVGVPGERIHTEQFQNAPAKAVGRD